MSKLTLSFKERSPHVERIRQVFQKIEPTSRYILEFGAHNGVQRSNALDLIEHGWGALLIEYDRDLAAACKALHRGNDRVTVLQAEISPGNIVGLMQDAGVPEDIDLITVDIDGYDFYVWEAIVGSYKPKAVMVEYNRSFEPPIRAAVPYIPLSDQRMQGAKNGDWVGLSDDFYGASLQSYCDLNGEHGYSPIWCVDNDAFFVRDEFFARFEIEDKSAAALYWPPTVTRWSRSRHPLRREPSPPAKPFHHSGKGYPHSPLWKKLGLL